MQLDRRQFLLATTAAAILPGAALAAAPEPFKWYVGLAVKAPPPVPELFVDPECTVPAQGLVSHGYATGETVWWDITFGEEVIVPNIPLYVIRVDEDHFMLASKEPTT